MPSVCIFVIDDDPKRIATVGERLKSELRQGDRVMTLRSSEWLKNHDELNPDAAPIAVVVGRWEGLVEAEIRKILVEAYPFVPLFFMDGPESKPNPEQQENDPQALFEMSLLQARLGDIIRGISQSADENHTPQRPKVEPRPLFRGLCGESPDIQKVKAEISLVAVTDSTVLILGATGTGKEVVARNIHFHSRRREKPFVPINCGAIPPELLESELFGHEKGAFTGAISTRTGRFEMADGGTLFLDEIGDMPVPMQVKLLRVLQERLVERVGSTKPRPVDVRIVAATHRNLDQLVASGDFREDLYFRLNVFPVHVPDLAQRIEDLPLLINEIACKLQRTRNASVKLTARAVKVLQGHHWPGNIRELSNLIERLSILYPNQEIDIDDLPARYLQQVGSDSNSSFPDVVAMPSALVPTTDGIDLKCYLADIETRLIVESLDNANGVVAHAAEFLKMSRTTLVDKMRKYDIRHLEPGKRNAN